MKKNKFSNFIELVKEKSIGYKSPIDFFIKLRTQNYSRLELMIIDSAIKKMLLENLHNTLLLTEEKYNIILDKISDKLSNI